MIRTENLTLDQHSISWHKEHFNNNKIRNAVVWNSVITLVTAHNTNVEEKTF